MDFTKDFVKHTLQNYSLYDGWSLQGFGMLRLYLSKDVRLHVWDKRFQVPNVSLIHTHPWDFTSRIVVGVMRNTRFMEGRGNPHMKSQIGCGVGGGLVGTPERVSLIGGFPERFSGGGVYHQRATEIHASDYDDGTVTVVTRAVRGDPDHADVYWPDGEQWVSAEPRPATPDEVASIIGYSLQRWFA
jgi:hypothetical protein